MQMSARMSPLMKRFYSNLWKQVTSSFKTSNLMEKLVINSLNALPMNIKKFLTLTLTLPNIRKRLCNVVPGRPVISNCGTPTERASEFLDYHLKPIMQIGKSYIKDSGCFINKIKNLQNILEGAVLVTADLVGLYPIIPHEVGLNTF